MKVLFLDEKILDTKKVLRNIGVTQYAYKKFISKSKIFSFFIKDMSAAIANILKQEALVTGADFAIAANAYYVGEKTSNGLLIATLSQLQKLKQHSLPQSKEIKHIISDIYETAKRIQKIKYVVLKDGKKHYFNKTEIMGILNITPDSFSDGGLFFNKEDALTHCVQMLKDAADIIDIGGESSRPGAEPVRPDVEISRVVPVLKQLKKRSHTLVSLDTYKPEVALAGLKNGADFINDIYALRFSNEMVRIVKDFNVPVIIMHMLGKPKTMQEQPEYENVVLDVIEFFEKRIEYLLKNGIPEEKIIIDPGIGFGKTAAHNIELINKINMLKNFGLPILVGASRKSFIGKMLDLPDPKERLTGTMATSAFLYGKADILRVHDVKVHKQLFSMLSSVKK